MSTPPSTGRLALGWDIAVTGDLASIWINAEDGGPNVGCGRRKLLANLIFKGCKLETQRRIIESMFDADSRLVGCGDQSGIGYSDCVKLKVKYPGRFEGVMFNGTSKLVIMTTLAGVFEQHLQMLPMAHPEIAADLAAFKNAKTPTGRLTWIHGSNELLPDSHCDIGISCALANHAWDTLDGGPCFMAPAPKMSDSSDTSDKSEWRGVGEAGARRWGF